jgi:hypothetical protein
MGSRQRALARLLGWRLVSRLFHSRS